MENLGARRSSKGRAAESISCRPRGLWLCTICEHASISSNESGFHLHRFTGGPKARKSFSATCAVLFKPHGEVVLNLERDILLLAWSWHPKHLRRLSASISDEKREKIRTLVVEWRGREHNWNRQSQSPDTEACPDCYMIFEMFPNLDTTTLVHRVAKRVEG